MSTTMERNIRPEVVYHISELQQRLGWGAAAMRNARKSGLQVYYVHNRAYVLGKDVIHYIESSRKANED